MMLSFSVVAHQIPKHHTHVLEQEFLTQKDPVQKKPVKPVPKPELLLEDYF